MTVTQSWNRFSYAYNNPLNYTDPSGHIPEGACGYGNWDCKTDSNNSAHSGGSGINQGGNQPGNIDEDTSDGQPPYQPKVPTQEPYLPLIDPKNSGTGSAETKEASGDSPYCDPKCLLELANGAIQVNDFIEAFDMPTIFRLFKGAWKHGRYAVGINPFVEGGVTGGLHFIDNLNNSNINLLQNLGQSILVTGETGVIDIAANTVGLSFAGMGGAAGALTPIPLIDETVGVIAGYLVGNYSASWLFTEIANDFNSAVFPAVGLGEFNP